MAPALENNVLQTLGINAKVKTGFDASHIEELPENARIRFERHGIDLSKGYPEKPLEVPIFLDEAVAVRNTETVYIDRGKNADPEKRALFGAAEKVTDLTKHIGTEIIGLQLADLSPQQLDELALLIAERTVVFFRNQNLSPQKQLEIGKYFGTPEVHPQAPHVPGLPGITSLWPRHAQLEGFKTSFKKPFGTSQWHTDLTHEFQPAGITHLHNDTIPSTGGDTLWASGYSAYDKLSVALQNFLDGKTAIYRSLHSYIDRDDPLSGPKYIEREHPIIRTHPATGWKSLFVNRHYTTRIVGLEPAESAAILELLFNVFEKNLDLQVRFKWQSDNEPGYGTSALWDNRISQHFAVFDYEGLEPRHGTRVTSLAEKPFLDPNSKSRREALGLSTN